MKKKLTALLVYALFWMAFFIFARLFFIFTHLREASQFGIGTLAATFLHGSRLDISATAYVLIIPLLAALSSIWIKGNWYRFLMKWYTWLLIPASLAIVVGDTFLYKYWGFRMDYTPLLYLKTPQDAAASATTAQIILFIVIVILLTVAFGSVYNRIISGLFNNEEKIRFRLPATLLFLTICGALIIPLRGGVGVARINAGTVYFSDYLFVNHTAINVLWNVGSSVFTRKGETNPYVYENPELADELVDTLTVKRGEPEKVIDNPRPNILLFILESFGNTLVGALGGDSLTTPYLNRIAGEGLLFSNFYASGNRTDKALPAILSGYPAQPAASILKDPEKTQSLPSIAMVLNRLGYRSSFWYGGDINFANFHSFLVSSGFHQIITKDNFDPAEYNSKWGVHDHVLFRALRDSMKTMKEPFFRVVLTLSSHEPFEVPMKPVFSGKDEATKFRNSVFYTDSTLGRFLDWAKGKEWWKNTLVVIVGDHCRRNSVLDLVFSEKVFKIPMLWLGGALDKKGARITRIGSQVDIPPTILDQMDLPWDLRFGKDLLSQRSKSFCFYTYNEGFAFITDTSAVVFDKKLDRPVMKRGRADGAEKYGKAYLQVLYDDYLKR